MAPRGNRGRGGSGAGASRGAPGAPNAPSFRGGYRGRGGGTPGAPRYKNTRDAELDMEVQALTTRLGFAQMNGDSPRGGFGRGRGRARGAGFGRGGGANYPTFNEYAYTYKGAKSMRGKGIGFRTPYDDRATPAGSGSRTPLRSINLANRPLLKPVKFVKAGTLFEDNDEIFEPLAPEIEEDDAPTSHQVEEVFSHQIDSSAPPTLSHTPANQSSTNLTRFAEFNMADVFAEADGAVEEIPTLSFGFTEADLNAPNYSTAAPRASFQTNQPIPAPSSQRAPPIAGNASSLRAAASPPPSIAPTINIEDLFRSAAFQAAQAPLHPPPPQPRSPPASGPHAGRVEDLYYIDTEGDAPFAPTSASLVVAESSATEVFTTITKVDVAKPSGDALFYIDTDGDHANTEPTTTTAYQAATTTTTSVVQAPQEDTEPAFEVQFTIDTEGTTSATPEVPQKIRYRLHRLDSAHRPLGEHTTSESGASTADAEDDDGDDEVVYQPPNASNIKAARLAPDISFAEIQGLETTVITSASNSKSAPLPTSLSRQAHTGMNKKLKKRAKNKRRKERSRAEKKAELAGMRDEDFDRADAADGTVDGEAAARVGDSDIEWGSDGPPPAAEGTSRSRRRKHRSKGKGKGKATAHSGTVAEEATMSPAEDDGHGMLIDSDLELEDAQYERMLANILGAGSGNFVTMDDMADEQKLREEDAREEEGEERGSSGDDDDEDSEAEVEFQLAETLEFDVDDDDDDEEDEEDEEDGESVSEDEEVSFSTKLGRMRARADQAAKDRPSLVLDSDDDVDDDDDDLFNGTRTWAADDEDALRDIEELLDYAMSSPNRRERKEILRALETEQFMKRNGGLPPGMVNKKKKWEQLPDDLRDVWKRDREKKAAYKKARAEQRLLDAQNPFPEPKSRKDKKGKGKAVVSASASLAASYKPDDDDFVDSDSDSAASIKPIVDMPSLVSSIRIFISDYSRQTMILPSMEKKSRKTVHELATAFGLKSKSTGKGKARHTTLIRTSRAGVNVREAKIRGILNRSGDAGFEDIWDRRAGDSGKGSVRHREGDVVGHKAAKIDEGNKGFKLLQQMGWKDGERIGATGGLAAPLTAVIKNTKLGLGAGTVKWST